MTSRTKFVATLVAGAILGCASVRAAVRALVVGINDYGGRGDLTSCVTDAKDVAAFLERTYGVPRTNIRILLDGDASKEGIKAAFNEHLIRGTAATDQIVFYFSGHGSITPNMDSVTPRRVDKALVPAKLPPQPNSWNDLISQATLDGWLASSPAKRQVVILDCCHSGTRTRGLSVANPVKGLDLGFSSAEMALTDETAAEAFPKAASGKTLLWLGACQSKQVSYCGRPNSLFTGKLLKALATNPGAAIGSVFPDVTTEVATASEGLPNGKQEPQIEGATSQPLLPASVAAVTQASPAPVAELPAPARPTPAPQPATGTTIAPASNPFTITAALDKTVYVTNDLAAFTISSSEDAFVRVFIISADAKQTQIFPNKWQTDNRITKGRPIRLPAEGETRWRLRITPPLGSEIMLVQARRTQFPDLAKGVEYTGLFMNLGEESPAQSRARGMAAEEIPEPATSPSFPAEASAPNGRAEVFVTYRVVTARE